MTTADGSAPTIGGLFSRLLAKPRQPAGEACLPFAAAEQVRPLRATLRRKGKAISCKAKIVGGWDRGKCERGYFGVKPGLPLPPQGAPQAGLI